MLKRASGILHRGFGCELSLVVRRVAKYPPGTLGEAYPKTGQLREQFAMWVALGQGHTTMLSFVKQS